MYKPSVETALKVFRINNYSYNTGIYSLNIFAIREKEKAEGVFTDTLCVLYKTEYGDFDLVAFPLCSDILLRYTESPILNHKASNVPEGNFVNSLKLYSLPGEKPSLVSSLVSGVFDSYKYANEWLNEAEQGFLEVNYKPYLRLNTASCKDQLNPYAQVLENESDMQELLELVKKSILITERNHFDYTIFSSADFK